MKKFLIGARNLFISLMLLAFVGSVLLGGVWVIDWFVKEILRMAPISLGMPDGTDTIAKCFLFLLVSVLIIVVSMALIDAGDSLYNSFQKWVSRKRGNNTT